MSKAWRWVSLVGIGALGPVLTNCGAGGGVPGLGGIPGAGALTGNCPNMANLEEVSAFDFAGNFKLSPEAGGKIKTGLLASLELEQFSAKVDADLKTACGGLAKDLGAPGEPKSGEEACKLAVKAIGDAKAKLGAKARIAVDVVPPHCEASMTAMADCAGKCDATVKPGQANVECEPGKLAGTCGGACEGTCDMSASAKCDGTCQGSCDVAIKGRCNGTCNGTCNGKDSHGACAGECDGKCDGNVEAKCGGKCGGTCKIHASAKCEGTCTGKCSVEMKEPKCRGEVKPPEMSAECKAKCSASVQTHAECSPAKVAVKVEGATDAKLAEAYKVALEKNLPVVLKIAVGLGEASVKMSGNVVGVVQGVEGSVKSAASGNAMTGAQLTACVAEPFAGVAKAAGSLKANVSVSVEVKASASASASGSAGTKG
jgi:hypothetical protein